MKCLTSAFAILAFLIAAAGPFAGAAHAQTVVVTPVVVAPAPAPQPVPVRVCTPRGCMIVVRYRPVFGPRTVIVVPPATPAPVPVPVTMPPVK